MTFTSAGTVLARLEREPGGDMRYGSSRAGRASEYAAAIAEAGITRQEGEE